MHFTEGRHREYERMMQEKPGFDRSHMKKIKEQECKYCQHFDKRSYKCSKEKCAIFDD